MGNFNMTGNRPQRSLFTSACPFAERGKSHWYLFCMTVLSVVVYVTLTQQAQACAASDRQTGEASWYGPGLQGNRTASGEPFDMWAMTAAHPCLPMGTKILVTVLETGRSLIVTVNDRLPSRRRVLDLSVGAARALGIEGQGVAEVQLLPAPLRVAAR